MKRADSIASPANVLEGAVHSFASLPLLLALGSSAILAQVAPGVLRPLDAVDPGGKVGTPPTLEAESVTEGAPARQEVNAGQVPVEEVPAAQPGAPAVADEPVVPEGYAEGGEAGRPAQLDGFVQLRSFSRWAVDRDVDDHDLFAVVGLDYIGAGEDPWGMHLLMRGSWGLNEQDPDSVFYGVQDTFTDRLEGHIYHAYADAPVGDSLGLVRFGRMVIYETPETVYVDGAHVETQPAGPTEFVMGAYGGVSVHQYESWDTDELLGGLYTRFRPWVDGSIRIDWLHLDDDVRFGEGQNDLIQGALTHRLGNNINLEGDYSVLDGESNDMHLRGSWFWPEGMMSLRVVHYQLLEAQNNLAYELNPFFNSLNTYFPYGQTQVVVTKSFDDVLELFGGVDMRRVEDEGDISEFNRDFDRYYLTTAFPELLPLRTSLSLTGEIWDSPDNEITSWGLDLTSQMREDTKLSLGSYYSLYKYYFDINTERDDVQTYYAELRKTLSDAMNVKARYEYEDEEIDSYHSLRLGVTWRF